MSRALLRGGLPALLLLLLVASPAQARIVDGIAAIVGDDIITLSEVREMAAAQMAIAGAARNASQRRAQQKAAWQEALDALIAERLLAQQVVKLNVEVGDEDVDAAVNDIMRRNGVDEETLKELLGRQGLTWEGYREDIKKQLTRLRLVEFKVKSQVSVSDEDIQNAYTQQFSSPRNTGELRLRRILIELPQRATPDEAQKAKAKAASIRARVIKGESFEALAKLYSDGRFATAGGDLGWMKPGGMLPVFEEAVKGLNAGEVSEPVRTPGGYMLLQVSELRKADVPPLEAVREQLRGQLYQQKVEQQLTKWIDSLRGDTFIDIKVEALARARKQDPR